MERTGESLNQQEVCAKVSDTAGFPEGQYSLNPAIPFFIEVSLHYTAPEHREAKGSLRLIIGEVDTVLKKKDPEMCKEAVNPGLDPNIRFNNVEVVATEKIGRETVQYVSNIYKYYLAYQKW